ncbi:DUF106 domain-containing protein [Candidatus Woesearchaeota archaeon]|nr:DUF106 domain-containing protein [Candidatus Woesearchaeota archaeon]
MGFTSFLDPVLDPLLNLDPALSIFILSFIVTLLITLVYKYATNQTEMKRLKTDMKESQAKIRKLSKENPQKAMEAQSQAMQKNLEYMKHSFKATFYTMIPVLIIFAWMSQNLAYYPIAPSSTFTVTGVFADGHASSASLSSIPELTFVSNQTQIIEYNPSSKENIAVWQLKGAVGEYKVTLDYNGEKYDHAILISEGKKYSAPEKLISDSKLKKIVVGNEKVYPFRILGVRFTWFWAYLVLSIGLSMLMRKILKIY